MILAEKISRLRKKNGWSQEELAERMEVSRQAVAKWENAQAIPNLDKILQLGELFGVTTDYLLKDEIEAEEYTAGNAPAVRRVSLEEANRFLDWRKTASLWIAGATLLCILAVIPLLILGAISEYRALGISEEFAATAGLAVLLILVAAAVAIFISCGSRNAPYEFLDKEDFEVEYGVSGMVRERQRAYKETYTRSNVTGICLCILSPIALFCSLLAQDAFLAVILLAVMLLVAGLGVLLLIIVGVRWASMQKLLQEGEFSAAGKRENRFKEKVGSAYWLIATAIYLAWSFATDGWERTWIVWPVAGVLFVAVIRICGLFLERGRSRQE